MSTKEMELSHLRTLEDQLVPSRRQPLAHALQRARASAQESSLSMMNDETGSIRKQLLDSQLRNGNLEKQVRYAAFSTRGADSVQVVELNAKLCDRDVTITGLRGELSKLESRESAALRVPTARSCP